MYRFYLCLWYKDDPKSQQKFIYYLARLKSRSIVRDSGTVSSFLTRDSIKKITLALGQNSSFSRGFDKILHMLLVSNPFALHVDLLGDETFFFFFLLRTYLIPGKFKGEFTCNQGQGLTSGECVAIKNLLSLEM